MFDNVLWKGIFSIFICDFVLFVYFGCVVVVFVLLVDDVVSVLFVFKVLKVGKVYIVGFKIFFVFVKDFFIELFNSFESI